MLHNQIPKINLYGGIETSKLDTQFNMPSARLDSIEQPGASDFKTVFSGLVENMNAEMEKPDALMVSLMNGDKNVDIHDVMTAMAKAELGISIATQITTKVIQSYEKITQIQV